MFTAYVVLEDGEEIDIRVEIRDVGFWERAGKGRSLARFQADVSITAVQEMAHLAARRQQLYTGTLTEFQELDLTFDMEEEPDPTRQGPSAGPSSPSPSTPESPRKSGPRKKNG